MSEALWQLNGVSLGEGAGARLRDISLAIRSGVTAVLGPSGAGKSSLLNLLVGFESSDGGKITAGTSADGKRLPLYWVPQNGGLWPHLTVGRHLEIVQPAGTNPARIGEMLDAFGIGEKASALPDRLSQGERSRLALARGLMAGAAVLVMDEPLVNVDVAQASRFWRHIRDSVDAAGASLIYSTHSPQMVIGEADRVICLKEGGLLYEGPVDELYYNPPNAEAAQCLGEVNWLLPEEAKLWLGRNESRPRCFRPEQISVARADLDPKEGHAGTPARAEGGAPIVVESSRFKGAVAETSVRYAGNGNSRLFTHRPSSNGLHAGDRVIIKALLGLMLALMVGCTRGKEPTLPVSAARTFAMPPEGRTIPGPRGMGTGLHDETVVTDTLGRVLVFGEDGRLVRQWKMPETSVGKPEGVCVLKDGRIVVADTHYHRVVYFDKEGAFLRAFGSEGNAPGQFIYPVGITKDEQENLYVCEYGGNDRVQKFTAEGEFILQFGKFGTGPGEFQRPSGLASLKGKIYVADAMNNRIEVYSDAGQFLGTLGATSGLPLHYPYDVKAGVDGALYVVEYGAGRVSKVGPDGALLGRYGRTGTGEGELKTPWGITVDSKRRIRVADTGNRRIVELAVQ